MPSPPARIFLFLLNVETRLCKGSRSRQDLQQKREKSRFFFQDFSPDRILHHFFLSVPPDTPGTFFSILSS